MVPLGDTPNTDRVILIDRVPVVQSSGWGAARLFTYLCEQVVLGFNNLGNLIERIRSFATGFFSCLRNEEEFQAPHLKPLIELNKEQKELSQELIQTPKSSQNLSYLLLGNSMEKEEREKLADEIDGWQPPRDIEQEMNVIEEEGSEAAGLIVALESNEKPLHSDSHAEEQNDWKMPNEISELEILDVHQARHTIEVIHKENFINVIENQSERLKEKMEPFEKEIAAIVTTLPKEQVIEQESAVNLALSECQDDLVSAKGEWDNVISSPRKNVPDEPIVNERVFDSFNHVQGSKRESLRKELRVFNMSIEARSATIPPLDTLTLSFSERLEWRKARFESRPQLPLLTPIERQSIENRHLEQLIAVKKTICGEIEKFGIDLSKDAKDKMIRQVAQHYLLTMQYYSPAIVLWIHSLLLHAKESNKKLVFLARDGIVFYDVAKILLEKNREKYGNYPEEHLIVAWLSRKSSKDLETRGDLAQRYFKQLGIEEHEPIILVDTGVTGSIKRNLSKLINNDLEAQFSISRNPAIYGFWDNSDFTIQAIALIILPSTHQDAWVNDPPVGNRWLEDTHRGNFIGAERFEEDLENGVIYPYPSMEMRNNHLVLKEVAVNSESDLCDFLIREFGRRAVTDFALSDADAEKLDYEQIKRNLNDLLTRIQRGERSIQACTHD